MKKFISILIIFIILITIGILEEILVHKFITEFETKTLETISFCSIDSQKQKLATKAPWVILMSPVGLAFGKQDTAKHAKIIIY